MRTIEGDLKHCYPLQPRSNIILLADPKITRDLMMAIYQPELRGWPDPELPKLPK